MSWIVISNKIMRPYMKLKCDNIMYMLCILSITLLGGQQRFMIKWSNVFLCIFKSMKWKVGASECWYLLIVNVFKVFGFRRWHNDIENSLKWVLIGMTFLGRLSSIMSCKLTCFLTMNLLKWTKMLRERCIATSFYT